MAKKGRKKKPSKEELEAERLAKEAEEERLRQEELQRQEEERKRREEEERRQREEEAARRAAEMERLSSEQPKVTASDNVHHDTIKREREERLEVEEWAAVLTTAELPSPGSEAEINTFLSELAEIEAEEAATSGARDTKAVVEAINSRIARAEVVARWLEDDAAVADDEGNTERASRSLEFARQLRDENGRRLDEATAAMLQGRAVFTRPVKDQEELHGYLSTGQGVAMALWCNLAGRKTMRPGKMEVPALGLRVGVARAVSTHVSDGLPTAIRVIRTPWDRVEASVSRAVEFAAKHGLPEPPGTEASGKAPGSSASSRASSARRKQQAQAEAETADGEEQDDKAPRPSDADEESKDADDADQEDAGAAPEADASAAEDAAAAAAASAGTEPAASGAGAGAGAGEQGQGDAVEAAGPETTDADADQPPATDTAGDGDGAAASASAGANAGGKGVSGPGEDGLHTVDAARPAPRVRTAPEDIPSLDEPVNEVVSVEMLALPAEARSVKRMQLLRASAISYEGVQRVSHPLQGGGMSQAVTFTLSLPPFTLVPDDVRMAYWNHAEKRWAVESEAAEETAVPEGTRELSFRTTYMMPMALVQPRTIDIPFKHWSMRPVDDITACVHAARAQRTAAGFVQPSLGLAALPRPDSGAPIGVPVVGDGGVPGSRSVTGIAPLGPAPIAPEDVAPAGGWDTPGDGSSEAATEDPASQSSASPSSSSSSSFPRVVPAPAAGGATTVAPELLPTTRRMPLPPAETRGVLLSLETARLRLDVVVGEDAAWLVGPCRPELAHLIGVGLRPGVLLHRLRSCGLRVTPDTVLADVPHVTIPVGAGKRRLIVKEAALEADAARRLARLACAVVVVPSVWNQRCSDAEFHCVVRVREAAQSEMEPPSTGTGAGVDEAHKADSACDPTTWRTVVGGSDIDAPTGVRWWLARTQEGAAAFDAKATGSVESSTTCTGALDGRITAEAATRAAGASSLLVEALRCLLVRFRLFSFTN